MTIHFLHTSPTLIIDDVGIVHEVYKTSKGLVSAWVSSKSSNPTHNNGLLIVIKGEHCGKYVRNFHHRYHEENGNKQPLIILAVVKKVEGTADNLNFTLIYSA